MSETRPPYAAVFRQQMVERMFACGARAWAVGAPLPGWDSTVATPATDNRSL